jgi:hypothetical protein
VAHGRQDRVCPVNNARIVHARLGTRASDKELLLLDRSHHIITRDVERGILRTRLEAFVRRMAQQYAAAGPRTLPRRTSSDGTRAEPTGVDPTAQTPVDP